MAQTLEIELRKTVKSFISLINEINDFFFIFFYKNSSSFEISHEYLDFINTVVFSQIYKFLKMTVNMLSTITKEIRTLKKKM